MGDMYERGSSNSGNKWRLWAWIKTEDLALTWSGEDYNVQGSTHDRAGIFFLQLSGTFIIHLAHEGNGGDSIP